MELIAVIKNGHSKREMDKIAERCLSSEQKPMTIAETLSYAEKMAKQSKPTDAK